jgi:transposase
MKGMLAMTDINTIKNLRNNHDKSIDHIRKELGVNWRTAKKYADGNNFPKKKKIEKTGMMYEEKWGDILTLWLAEDAKLPKKKRRTNVAYHRELKELDFPGSYRTVCVFVQDWRSTHNDKGAVDKGFERLEHPPADAQLDFGTMEVEHEGSFKDVKTLVMTFPFSNVGFAVALPAENQECLFEGMTQLFHQIGGVPKVIRIDNMSTAVTERKSKYKPAVLTEAYLRFATHYRFNTQVCNPRSGNEKGSVENKVGYIRYNFFPTSPSMKDYASLNEKLRIQLIEDRDRNHYEKNVSIIELWEEEKTELLALPDVPYPVFKEIECKANKYNEIKLDQTLIHVPKARNHTKIYAVLTAETYTFYSGSGDIIAEGDRPYMFKKRPIDWASILLDWRKKLRSMEYSRYWKYLPERIKLYLTHNDWKVQAERVDILINLLVTKDMKQINERFYELIGVEPSSDSYNVDWNSYDALGIFPKEVV